MKLERQIHPLNTAIMRRLQLLSACIVFLLSSWTLPTLAQYQNSRKPELIRDTDTAEGKEEADVAKPKEPNPQLAEQNINIGNFYYKKGNYAAAIQRYLEAIEYEPNSIRAYEAITRAYEKNGEPVKAIKAYKDFIEKNPDSPKSSEFRVRLAKLEKKSN